MMPATANATYVNGVDTFFGDNVHAAFGVDGSGNARSHIVWDGTNLVIDVSSDATSAAALNLLGGVFQKAGVEVPTENDITTALATASAGSTFASILGAVGQGAIVDEISNSNGTAVRWESGIQICWSTSVAFDAFSTNRLRAGWTFPASFSSDVVVVKTLADSTISPFLSNTGMFMTNETLSATSVTVTMWSGDMVSSDVDNLVASPAAIGLWK